MNFLKYTQKESWEESLQIFLFTNLQALTDANLTLELYTPFQLTDKNIEAYNDWIAKGAVPSEALSKWITLNPDQIEEFKREFGTKYMRKVVMWSDRAKTDYYKEKLQGSYEFENFLEDLLRTKYGLELQQYLTPEGQYEQGENELGIEIKNDTLVKKTGNVYIEYAEKSNANNSVYVPSGILKQDTSEYFLIGDREKFYIFRKKRLIEIYEDEVRLRNAGEASQRNIRFVQIKTSKGFVMPVGVAAKEAITIDTLVAELKAKG